MKKKNILNKINNRRSRRTRIKLRSITSRVRLSVFRSNNNIHAQIIDDSKQKTLVSASSLEIKAKGKENKTVTAGKVGKALAEKAMKAGIKEVVFDKGKYKYHGRVKALAEGAREGGLSF
ncbi:50S ribosomal protein L18 [Patescibacteria group bacterium]|nr:50S ribosomal protein L18 [Patescibacteria group bacterium]